MTIDAMGTQTAIAEKIRLKRGDYVLALKENQRTLHEDVSLYLNDAEIKEELRKKGKYKKTIEKAHSQLEIREYYQTKEIGWLSQKKDWKGLFQLFFYIFPSYAVLLLSRHHSGTN